MYSYLELQRNNYFVVGLLQRKFTRMFSITTGACPGNFRQIEQELYELRVPGSHFFVLGCFQQKLPQMFNIIIGIIPEKLRQIEQELFELRDFLSSVLC